MAYIQKIPFRNHVKDLVYMNIQVWEVLEQPVEGRKPFKWEVRQVPDARYSFLAPNEILETINHNWKPYDSMAGRVGQAIAKMGNMVKDVRSSVTKKVSSESYQMDAPMVFDGSDRRKFTLTVQFHDQDNPQEHIDVITSFRSYGCARIGDGKNAVAKIENPYVFQIWTTPNDFMSFEMAALGAMNITYKYPFMNGLATQAEMVLEFEDLQPLYEQSFKTGATVTTAVG